MTNVVCYHSDLAPPFDRDHTYRVGKQPNIAELRQREERLREALDERIKAAVYLTRHTEAEIRLALEDRGTINYSNPPIPSQEYDPDGSVGWAYTRWKATKTALDKVSRPVP